MNEEQQLLDMKEKIELAEKEVAGLDGQIKAEFQRLKDEFGCDSIESADELWAQMDSKRLKLKEEITMGIQDLQTDYEW